MARYRVDAELVRAAIDRYFIWEPFTGARFELLAGTDAPDFFTAQDIVAVSMLGVTVPAAVSVWLLLEEGRMQTHALLRQVPTDLDLWNAGDHIAKTSPLWQLWDLLHNQKGVGPTICSKLLAAKRPRLVPIQDSVVMGVIGPTDDVWRAVAHTLASPEDRARLTAATDNAPDHVSLLRRIDVVLWMLNRQNRLNA